MKAKTKDRIRGMFSARAEKAFYTVAAIYIVAVFVFQTARFIIQNL